MEGQGFYRFPSVSGRTIVFVAEGNVWSTTLLPAAAPGGGGSGSSSSSAAAALTTCGGCRWPKLNKDGTVRFPTSTCTRTATLHATADAIFE